MLVSILRSIQKSILPLKSFDPKNPPNSKDLELLPVSTECPDIYCCSNGYYAFFWNETDESPFKIYAESGSGLFRINGRILAGKSRILPGAIHFKHVKDPIRETDLLYDYGMERLILIRTLLSLERIMDERYGMHILHRTVKERFEKECWHENS